MFVERRKPQDFSVFMVELSSWPIYKPIKTVWIVFEYSKETRASSTRKFSTKLPIIGRRWGSNKFWEFALIFNRRMRSSFHQRPTLIIPGSMRHFFANLNGVVPKRWSVQQITLQNCVTLSCTVFNNRRHQTCYGWFPADQYYRFPHWLYTSENWYRKWIVYKQIYSWNDTWTWFPTVCLKFFITLKRTTCWNESKHTEIKCERKKVDENNPRHWDRVDDWEP